MWDIGTQVSDTTYTQWPVLDKVLARTFVQAEGDGLPQMGIRVQDPRATSPVKHC